MKTLTLAPLAALLLATGCLEPTDVITSMPIAEVQDAGPMDMGSVDAGCSCYVIACAKTCDHNEEICAADALAGAAYAQCQAACQPSCVDTRDVIECQVECQQQCLDWDVNADCGDAEVDCVGSCAGCCEGEGG